MPGLEPEDRPVAPSAMTANSMNGVAHPINCKNTTKTFHPRLRKKKPGIHPATCFGRITA
jgi:hypothetical protein